MSEVSSYFVGIEFESGSFTNVTDDVTLIDIARSLADLTVPLEAGEANIELENQDGKYSNGAFASLVRPNLEVRVEATHSNSTRGIFTGYIDEWTFTPDLAAPRRANIACRDSFKILQRASIVTSARINADVGSLFTEVLSLSGVNSFFVGEVDRNIPFFHLREQTFGEAMQIMLGLTHAYAFVCPQRCLRVENRHLGANDTPVGSWDTTSNCIGLEWAMTDDGTFNKVLVETIPRVAATETTSIAALEDPVVVPASGWTSFAVNYIDPDTREAVPATEIITPVASEDWKATISPLGGSQVTSTTSLSIDIYGATAVNTFFNGTDRLAYITKYVIRGKPIARLSDVRAEETDAAAQADYGELQFSHSNEFIGGAQEAGDLAKFMIERYKTPFPAVSVSYRNDFPKLLDTQVADVVHLVSSFTSVASEFVIRSIEHSIDAEGWIHDTIFGLDLNREFDGLVLTNNSLGVLDGTRTAVY